MPPEPSRFLVRSFEADAAGRLALPALCAFLQEAARADAAAMGAGVEVLAREGLAWMMQRLRLEIAGDPRAGDTLEVASWARQWERVGALRDFEVRTPVGERVAAGTSRWLVVDLASRRLLRLPDFVRALPLPGRPPALALDDAGLPRAGHAEHECRLEVRRSDLDAARHANCARYVEWALEPLPGEWLETHRPVRLELVFRRESLAGDVVLSRAQRLGSGNGALGWAHQLVREPDGAELAQAVSGWEPLTRPQLGPASGA